MTRTLVSVVIATYHRTVELRRALESVAVQSYSNFEIIVVDDNAEEEWERMVCGIIDSFKKDNPSIKLEYISVPNLGSARARNVGIEHAKGEYVCFLDDDDVYLPRRIENQLVQMIRFEADYSITDLKLYSESDKLIETRKRDYIEQTDVQTMVKYHLKYHLTGTDTMMFKRDYLLKIGCFSPIDVGDEFYLMNKAINARGRFVYVHECDVKAYVHTGQNGLSSGLRKIDGENELFEYKKKFFGTLDSNTIKYIKMRHFAVLAFAYLRMRKYGVFLREAIKSFLSSPIACVKLFLERC